MPTFALIKASTNEIIEFRDLPQQPVDIPHKNIKWLPFIETPEPELKIPSKTFGKPIYVVKHDRVEMVHIVQDKPQQSITRNIKNPNQPSLGEA